MKHPKKMYFLIVKIVIPGQYLGPNRGSKFNIEISTTIDSFQHIYRYKRTKIKSIIS